MAKLIPKLTQNDLDRMIKILGGKGSGNFGHKGRPGQVGGSGPGGGGQDGQAPSGWSRGGDNQTAKKFVAAREQVPKDKQPYLSHYTAAELVKNGGTIYVSDDGKNGFVIAPDGDIQNVFSANHRGKDIMTAAIKNGGTKLDCFDGFLPKFYSGFGFKEYKREANWTEGGPDVIFMRRS